MTAPPRITNHQQILHLYREMGLAGFIPFVMFYWDSDRVVTEAHPIGVLYLQDFPMERTNPSSRDCHAWAQQNWGTEYIYGYWNGFDDPDNQNPSYTERMNQGWEDGAACRRLLNEHKIPGVKRTCDFSHLRRSMPVAGQQENDEELGEELDEELDLDEEDDIDIDDEDFEYEDFDDDDFDDEDEDLDDDGEE